MPIIVGGTNYYIESLLWSILVDNKTNLNDQGQFTLYETDKIRNLDLGHSVMESLWKLDNEKRKSDDQRDSVKSSGNQSAAICKEEIDNEMTRTVGHDHEMIEVDSKNNDIPNTTPDSQNNAVDSDKRKNKGDFDDVRQQTTKKIKTDNSVGIKASSPTKENEKETFSKMISKETTTSQKGSDSDNITPKESVSVAGPTSLTANVTSNRQGIQSLVNVLDTLRGKLIENIQQANQFSHGIRTLKDLMEPVKEKDAYEKMDLKFKTVKDMFEDLDKQFEKFKGTRDEFSKEHAEGRTEKNDAAVVEKDHQHEGEILK